MAMKKGELTPALMPQVFEHKQFGQLRWLMINNDPWFVATDVCRALEIKQPTRALKRLDDDEKGVTTIHTLGGEQNLLIVSEPGLYRLIMRSRKPSAMKFQRWVCHEVLPSIREYGYYSVTEKPAEKPLTEREKLIKKINDEDPDDEIEFTGITLDTIRGKQVISYGCKLHGELAEKIWAEFLTGKTAFALMTYEKNKKDD